MNAPKKTSNSRNQVNTDLALEKAREQESWFRVVVKIVSWKDGLSGSGTHINREKVTAKEWKLYTERILKNSVTYGKDKALKDLKETEDKINSFDGFEKAEKPAKAVASSRKTASA